MLKGIEVVFMVIAIGAGDIGLLLPASFDTLAALLLVLALGVLVCWPLSRIPEKGFEFAVVVLLSAFGAFWFGKGTGIGRPGSN